MPKPNLLAALLATQSLDDLAAVLKSSPKRIIAQQLFQLFDAHAEYDDAEAWAAAVRICEALAIVGWSPRERVDAVSWFNGDHWQTSFVNDQGETRFRDACWTKRKAGWMLFNPEFYSSPDWPNRPSVGWMKYAPGDHPACNRPDLPSQRNYQKQMPIVMSLIGAQDKTMRAVDRLRGQLYACLAASMQPSVYGDALEHFYFTLYCPYSGSSAKARLKIGALNTRQRAFYSELHFARSFGQLAPRRQRDYFATNLLAAVDALASKLAARRISYDIARFRADVALAIGKFLRRKTS